jgi:hypothetical protein
MNDRTDPTHPARQCLSALLPPDAARPEALCSEEALRRLEEQWSRLEGLGFTLEVRAGSLRVRHGNRRFETVLHFGGPDDLDERRRLFAELKAAFGGFRDRFPWLWQSSPAVTIPYESLKAVAEVCQAVRTNARRAG